MDDKGASVFRQNEDGLCTYSSAGQSDPAKVIVAFWEQKEDAE